MRLSLQLLRLRVASVAVAAAMLTACTEPTLPTTPPALLSIVSGDLQHAVAGQELPNPLVVEVLDSLDRPIAGQIVNFVVTAGAGSVFAGAALTNAAGRASERWTLGVTPGDSQSVEARAVHPVTGAPLVFATFYAVADTPSTGVAFASVAAGGSVTCGLTPAGAAWCWGVSIGAGGSPRNVAIPTAVAGGRVFTAIATGAAHACALTADGTAFCWGDNEKGQIGNGASGVTVPTPVAVAGGRHFATIAAGSRHTCALDSAGVAWCWGQNSGPGPLGGALGDSTTVDRFTPVAVRGGVAFSALSLGIGFSCGVTAAGAANCWGDQYGLTPSAVPGGRVFGVITAGGSHACGLVANGDAYCWGSNASGQLADDTLIASALPLLVRGGLKYVRIAAGHGVTTALDQTGQLYYWGWSDGTLDSRTFNSGVSIHTTTPTLVPAAPVMSALTMSSVHGCGTTPGQAAYCWFNNQVGQLGLGVFSAGSFPAVRVR